LKKKGLRNFLVRNDIIDKQIRNNGHSSDHLV